MLLTGSRTGSHLASFLTEPKITCLDVVPPTEAEPSRTINSQDNSPSDVSSAQSDSASSSIENFLSDDSS